MHRTAVDLLRMQRGVNHLRILGPRAMAELLWQICDETGHAPLILALLDQYQKGLTPELLAATGGDRFPPHPLRQVA